MVTGGNAVARKIVLVHRVAGNEIGPQPVPLYKKHLGIEIHVCCGFPAGVVIDIWI